ncbi:hypothetical protein B0H17DRAFT_1188060 [Mycena rosella]|uniref:Uncharacterized protein n=1 Tax=Mycena rosella TaxID=1033263 RepID=A0AAD7BP76_MYCRO|nr:hypothetical protein B0H17DRAFT_1188060 [Mycena rosella]
MCLSSTNPCRRQRRASIFASPAPSCYVLPPLASPFPTNRFNQARRAVVLAADVASDVQGPARPRSRGLGRLDAAWASDIQGPSPSPQAGLQARASGLGPGLKYIFPRLRSWGRHRQFHSYAKSSDLICPPGPGLGARLGLQNVEARALSPPRPAHGPGPACQAQGPAWRA